MFKQLLSANQLTHDIVILGVFIHAIHFDYIRVILNHPNMYHLSQNAKFILQQHCDSLGFLLVHLFNGTELATSFGTSLYDSGIGPFANFAL